MLFLVPIVSNVPVVPNFQPLGHFWRFDWQESSISSSVKVFICMMPVERLEQFELLERLEP
jgi:hypothetical protein